MKLNSSITVDVQGSPLVLEKLDIVLIDDVSRKIVLAKVHQRAKPLMLWKDQTYDQAGDYTQAQVESRILELLGDDLQKGLQDLFTIQVL